MSEALNVTHVVLSLDVGGLERNVINQIREGQLLGQQVSVVCVERPGTLAPRAMEMGAAVVCLDKRPGVRPELIRRMAVALRYLRPDVVHTHQIGPLFYTGLAARLARVPVLVHTEHGMEDYGHLRKRYLGRLAGSFVDRIYCVTERMRAAVVARRIVGSFKTRIIDNGIDLESFLAPTDPLEIRRTLGIPRQAPVIGTVGRLAPVKQHDLLLRAFAQVRARFAGVRLLLVGDGPLLADLRELADRLGVGDSVHFAGYQPLSAPYLRAMNVFALTSQMEGMPQALLEAAVVGVPAVAAAVGGVPEMIEHGKTGLLFEPGDAAALADGLCLLLTDRPLALQMSTAASAHVQAKYSVRRMAAEYHRDFQELLARAGRRRCGPRRFRGCAGFPTASAPSQP